MTSSPEHAYTIAVVANGAAGRNLDGGKRDWAETLAPLGEVVSVAEPGGQSFQKTLEEVFADKRTDLVVAAGGDGTVSACAHYCVETGKALLPLPFGTFNLFSRAIGIGPDPEPALAALETYHADRIDVGRVNGQVFLHHVSGGLHTRFVRFRDAVPYASRLGKMLAGVRALHRAARTLPRQRMRIETDGTPLDFRTAGYAVTVNGLAEAPGQLPVAEDPQGGRLVVYVTRLSASWQVAWMILQAMFGRWNTNDLLEPHPAHKVVLGGRKRGLSVTVDGERRRLGAPVTCEIEQQALPVLRPSPENAW